MACIVLWLAAGLCTGGKDALQELLGTLRPSEPGHGVGPRVLATGVQRQPALDGADHAFGCRAIEIASEFTSHFAKHKSITPNDRVASISGRPKPSQQETEIIQDVQLGSQH